MKMVLNILTKLLMGIVAVLGLAMVADVSLQILGRYVFVKPIPWTEEVSRFLLVGIVTFAAPLAARDDRFIRVDVLLNRLPERYRRLVLLVLDAAVAVFLFIVAYQAVGLARVGHLQKSAVLRIPMSYLFSCMVICPALSGVYFLGHVAQAAAGLKDGRKADGKEH